MLLPFLTLFSILLFGFPDFARTENVDVQKQVVAVFEEIVKMEKVVGNELKVRNAEEKKKKDRRKLIYKILERQFGPDKRRRISDKLDQKLADSFQFEFRSWQWVEIERFIANEKQKVEERRAFDPKEAKGSSEMAKSFRKTLDDANKEMKRLKGAEADFQRYKAQLDEFDRKKEDLENETKLLGAEIKELWQKILRLQSRNDLVQKAKQLLMQMKVGGQNQSLLDDIRDEVRRLLEAEDDPFRKVVQNMVDLHAQIAPK